MTQKCLFIFQSLLYTFIDKGEQLIENVAVPAYLSLAFFSFAKNFNMDKEEYGRVANVYTYFLSSLTSLKHLRSGTPTEYLIKCLSFS